MYLEQVKVNVQDLVKGMYVCKLDRPWIETPFPFQGFYVSCGKDINILNNYCAYVYVDIVRGKAPASKYNGGSKQWKVVSKGNKSIPRPTKIRVRRTFYKKPQPFKKEIKKAEVLFKDINRATAQLQADLKVGLAADLSATRRASHAMVDSVIRNPDVFVWLSRLQNHDQASYHHSVRSSIWATFFGRHLGLSEDKLYDLSLGVLLCDIGNTKISRQLLEKSSHLSDDERERIHKHVEIGVDILERCGGIPDRVIDIVAKHHERFDGSGYGKGLVGDQIPLLARIAGIVDSYDAMTNPRPHRKALTAAQALDVLFEQRDHLFQSQLIDEFIQAVGIYPSGSLVRLNSGEVGVVISHNFEKRLRPEVACVLDSEGERYENIKVLDLCSIKNEKHSINVHSAVAADEVDIDLQFIHEQYIAKKIRWSFLGLN
ncbi:MAG: HD-GYP domain-containing protein [bacterium]